MALDEGRVIAPPSIHPDASSQENDDEEDPPPPTDDCLQVFEDALIQPPTPSPLLLHARVYTLAECYDILELKPLALRKFKDATKDDWSALKNVPDFLGAAREAYTSTTDADSDLRHAVARLFHCHRKQLLSSKEGNDLLLENGCLGRDITLQSI